MNRVLLVIVVFSVYAFGFRWDGFWDGVRTEEDD